jgi:hypothetical protein
MTFVPADGSEKVTYVVNEYKGAGVGMVGFVKILSFEASESGFISAGNVQLG